MDDSCVVCAEALVWTAYGGCGHREVCSTCVVRLRFILGDRRCCLCKTDNPSVFVTKAMGDYTRVITDFSLFPANATEGKVGEFWYHESTQAYFDDADQYRMIRATCRLSCGICDKNGVEQGKEATKRSGFKCVEQLKGHLYHQHRLFMCSLCLEGRKVFICEQKLYSRTQLNQHIRTGNSEVDGSESERGGFMGHPMCKFCRDAFYGDNELYMHMSTEHYTCHICQRHHPGQYDYYPNYDNLESHFRQEHFLCENEACLAKKFIVFQTEAEIKRHNATEHGGHMSRSKRNVMLQIPTSFRYQQTNEQNQLRVRRHGFRPDPSSNQLSVTFQASYETSIADSRSRGQSSGALPLPENVETSQLDAVSGSLEALIINSSSELAMRPPTVHGQNSRNVHILEEISFPPLSDMEIPELSSRSNQGPSQNSVSAAWLGKESFPLLPGAKKSIKRKGKSRPVGLGQSTLAGRIQLHNQDSVTVLNSVRSRPFKISERSTSTSASSSQGRPTPSHGLSSSSSAGSLSWSATTHGGLPTSSVNPRNKPMRGNISPIPSTPAWIVISGNRIRHSSSEPDSVEGGSTSQALPTSGQSKVEDTHAANKSVVERIRAGLELDEDKFAAFKSISGEYRHGLINTWEYLSYVEQFGLSCLVLEIAQLCPDAQKKKELIDAYNANIRGKGRLENGESTAASAKESKVVKKGKGLYPAEASSTRDATSDSFMSTVKKIQLNHRLQGDVEVEVLLKDGYRTAKDKLTEVTAHTICSSKSLVNSSRSNQNPGGGESSKQHQKTSKFDRVRLGDGPAAALLNLNRTNVSPEREGKSGGKTSGGLPVRSVWRNGGGLKLISSQKDSSNK